MMELALSCAIAVQMCIIVSEVSRCQSPTGRSMQTSPLWLATVSPWGEGRHWEGGLTGAIGGLRVPGMELILSAFSEVQLGAGKPRTPFKRAAGLERGRVQSAVQTSVMPAAASDERNPGRWYALCSLRADPTSRLFLRLSTTTQLVISFLPSAIDCICMSVPRHHSRVRDIRTEYYFTPAFSLLPVGTGSLPDLS